MSKKNAKKEQLGGDALRRKLREDDVYKKYKRILANITEKLNPDDFYTEIKGLHSGRKMRNLYGTTPGADKIGDAVLQDVRCRSRLVELILKATKYHDNLDIALDETRKYLAHTFADDAPDLRTKAERQSYFDMYLTTGINVKAKLTSMIEAANLIVKDIDQCSHATRHLISCLELVLDRNDTRQRV